MLFIEPRGVAIDMPAKQDPATEEYCRRLHKKLPATEEHCRLHKKLDDISKAAGCKSPFVSELFRKALVWGADEKEVP